MGRANKLGLMLLTKWRYTKLYTGTLFVCGFFIYDLFYINNVFSKFDNSILILNLLMGLMVLEGFRAAVSC